MTRLLVDDRAPTSAIDALKKQLSIDLLKTLDGGFFYLSGLLARRCGEFTVGQVQFDERGQADVIGAGFLTAPGIVTIKSLRKCADDWARNIKISGGVR